MWNANPFFYALHAKLEALLLCPQLCERALLQQKRTANKTQITPLLSLLQQPKERVLSQ